MQPCEGASLSSQASEFSRFAQRLHHYRERLEVNIGFKPLLNLCCSLESRLSPRSSFTRVKPFSLTDLPSLALLAVIYVPSTPELYRIATADLFPNLA